MMRSQSAPALLTLEISILRCAAKCSGRAKFSAKAGLGKIEDWQAGREV